MSARKNVFDKSDVTFPSKRQVNFLAHCSISPLFHKAAQAMANFHDTMAERGVASLPKFFHLMGEFHKSAGSLLQTSPENISYIHNTAEALCMVANGYPFDDGDEVISYIHEYPSNHYPWVLQKKRGVILKLLSDCPPLPEQKEIDKPRGWSMEELESIVTKKTRIVALSHVQFTSGFAADLETLGSFCHSHNIDLVVDCAQSLGCLPVYPEKFHISALVASGWKWLLGPKGSGLLYTAPEFREKIDDTMAGPAMMEQGLDYLDHSWKPLQDGRKYEYSTLPWDHVAGMNCVLNEIFLKYSPEMIRDEVFRLQDKARSIFNRQGLQVLDFPQKNRSGIIAMLPRKDHRKIVSDLLDKDIVISAPVGYLRFAPHFYNDDNQIEEGVSHLNDLV